MHFEEDALMTYHRQKAEGAEGIMIFMLAEWSLFLCFTEILFSSLIFLNMGWDNVTWSRNSLGKHNIKTEFFNTKPAVHYLWL